MASAATKSAAQDSIKVGSKVRITGTHYATGQKIPDWVKSKAYTVSQISSSKALLDKNGICSWVKLNDLKLDGAHTTGGQTTAKTETKKEETKKEETKTESMNKAGYVSGTGGSGLNVRSGAGTHHSRIGGLSEGASVTIVASKNGWYQIKYGSGKGWVSSSYIKIGEKKTNNNSSNKTEQSTSGGGAVSTNGVPLYAQGDSRWGSRTLGKNCTIKSHGCAMTSTAMCLSKIGGREITPADLDAYLDKNGGYSGDCIYWNTAARMIGRSATAYSSMKQSVINSELNSGRPVVISVKSEGHWVCVAGRKSDGTYIIHDPAGGKIRDGKWNGSYVSVSGYSKGSCLRTF
jgi:uncharacterized protein YraI